jgi:hypothetical protein
VISRLFEIASLFVRLKHITTFIENAIGSSGRRARSNNREFRSFRGMSQRENRRKNEYTVRNG